MSFLPSLNHKLRSNDPLTYEEATIARRILGGSLDRLQALDNEITRLQNNFDRLSLEQRNLHAFVEGHKRFLSPARRLLPEILQEIFYHCLPIAHNAVMSIEEPPLLLSRVCSQWRRIACSTPKLWASIHIVVTASASRLDEARQEAISTWLSRSGVLPLSISMSTSGLVYVLERYGSSDNQVQPYLDLIAPYTRRWKSIYLDLQYFSWIDFFTRFEASDLPFLESLHIEGSPSERTASTSVTITTLPQQIGILQAPRLRVLSLWAYVPRLLDLPVQWKDLTGLSLGIDSPPYEDAVKTLALCLNLESCAISLIPSVHDSLTMGLTYRIPEITLPKLRTLSIINRLAQKRKAIMVLESLSTPVLRHFSYDQAVHLWSESPIMSSFEDRFSSSLRSFLHKIIHPLEELELRMSPFLGGYALKTLPLLPGLKRLSLKGYGTRPPGSRHAPPLLSISLHMEDDFLEHFIPRKRGDVSPLELPDSSDVSGDEDEGSPPRLSTCLCPKLEVFHCTGASFSDQIVLDFLRSRTVDHCRHDLAHLRKVSISFGVLERDKSGLERGLNSDMEIRNQIEVLEKETGLLVRLQYPSIDSLPPLVAPRYSPYASPGAADNASTGTPGAPKYFGF